MLRVAVTGRVEARHPQAGDEADRQLHLHPVQQVQLYLGVGAPVHLSTWQVGGGAAHGAGGGAAARGVRPQAAGETRQCHHRCR